MNKPDPAILPILQDNKKKHLKGQVQKIVAEQNLDGQRQLIEAIAAALNITVLDCAAALAYLSGHGLNEINQAGLANVTKIKLPPHIKPTPNTSSPGIRLVRYRLAVGLQHKASQEALRKLLVEESGVDIKNIVNVRIQGDYTLIDLPDEMPQEIFHHLKTVEINGQKLTIRRVKPRNKKRGDHKHRQASRSIGFSVPANQAVQEIGGLSSGNTID
jgi:DbpA RNA binding domain